MPVYKHNYCYVDDIGEYGPQSKLIDTGPLITPSHKHTTDLDFNPYHKFMRQLGTLLDARTFNNIGSMGAFWQYVKTVKTNKN